MNAVIVFSLLATFSQTVANPRPQLHIADSCLPLSEFSLSGVHLRQNGSEARKILGKPRRITREKGEDDGGVYLATVLHYRHLKVEIVRGIVDRLYTDSSRTSVPSGIKPGMKYDDVKRVLGKEPKEIDGYPYAYKACDESAYFALRFDSNMVLSSIDISADRP
jgi:hypothetical protein